MQPITFGLLGLSTGSAFALLALGLVLTYRGSGVINFAHGGIAMYATYAFVNLRDGGDLYLPVSPVSVSVGESVPTGLAMLWGLGVGAALSASLYVVVFRPLRNAPPLANVVASVGILLTLQAIAVLQFGSTPESTGRYLPDGVLRLGDQAVPVDRFYLLAAALLITALLVLIFKYTNFGLATRAAATNERGSLLLGLSPQRLALSNWTMAGALAALAGMLLVPTAGLNPTNYALLVVPALGAALIGRLTSFTWTALGGLLIGVLQSEILYLQSFSWYPSWGRIGVAAGLPFVLIILFLFLFGRRLPARGFSSARLPRSPQPLPRRRQALIVLTMGGAAAILLVTGPSSLRLAIIVTVSTATILLSLTLLTGFLGQISLAQAAFAGTAGFALSRFSVNLDLPFPIGPVLAVAFATLVGSLVGIPALRIRGVQLAVVTLAGAVAVEEFLFKNPSFTGGAAGAPVPEPQAFGTNIGPRAGGEFPRPLFGLIMLLLMIAIALLVSNIRRGATGRRMLAIRANEGAAAACGVDVAQTKLAAFAISSAIAGTGGVMLGYLQGQLSFGSFTVFIGLGLLALAYLGGIASVAGAVVGGAIAAGGIVFAGINEFVDFGRYIQLVSGLGLVITALLNQEGIVGAVTLSVRQVRDRFAPRRASDMTSQGEGSEVTHVAVRG